MDARTPGPQQRFPRAGTGEHQRSAGPAPDLGPALDQDFDLLLLCEAAEIDRQRRWRQAVAVSHRVPIRGTLRPKQVQINTQCHPPDVGHALALQHPGQAVAGDQYCPGYPGHSADVAP